MSPWHTLIIVRMLLFYYFLALLYFLALQDNSRLILYTSCAQISHISNEFWFLFLIFTFNFLRMVSETKLCMPDLLLVTGCYYSRPDLFLVTGRYYSRPSQQPELYISIITYIYIHTILISTFSIIIYQIYFKSVHTNIYNSYPVHMDYSTISPPLLICNFSLQQCETWLPLCIAFIYLFILVCMYRSFGVDSIPWWETTLSIRVQYLYTNLFCLCS